MKIFQVTTFFHPVVGGVESHVYALAKELKSKGHEVEILCSDSGKNGPRIKTKKDSLGDIKITRFRNLLSLSYFHKFYPGIFFYLMRNDWDLIHIHGFRKIETYLALLAAKLKKKKIVLTTHNPFPTTSRSDRMKFFVKIHDKTMGRWFTKHLDKIIILVKSEREILKKMFKVDPKKIALIPNGIEPDYFVPGDAKKFYKDWNIDQKKYQTIVSSAGRISYTKGFQYLYKAIKDHPKFLFFFAGGDDGYLKYLKQKFQDLENVYFTERYLPKEKLIDMYTASDFFLFPSIHEPFGIVLLEALASGTPVICSNQGGPSEFLSSELVTYVNPTDEQAWSDQITRLFSNKKLVNKMSADAKKEMKNYLWSKISDKIIKLYKSL